MLFGGRMYGHHYNYHTNSIAIDHHTTTHIKPEERRQVELIYFIKEQMYHMNDDIY